VYVDVARVELVSPVGVFRSDCDARRPIDGVPHWQSRALDELLSIGGGEESGRIRATGTQCNAWCLQRHEEKNYQRLHGGRIRGLLFFHFVRCTGRQSISSSV